MSNYNAVEEAYSILTKAFFDEDTSVNDLAIAIEEAIGFLGEALSD